MANLFFSYSHKDEELRNELETHLALMKRQGIISSWYDRRITAGSDIDEVISAELESAQIILLLISADFIASDYCFQKEMGRALQKDADGSAVVIPVILHPCDWHSAPFGHLRATPTDGKAISKHANLQEALSIVAKDVRAAASTLQASPRTAPTSPMSGLSIAKPEQKPRSSNLRVKRKFDDHEKDVFMEDSYQYIARFFDASLDELSTRNSQFKTRFKRIDANSFSVSVYENGERVAQCSIWQSKHFRSSSIAYSHSDDTSRNSFNESLSVIDDGYALQLQPLGMGLSRRSDKPLSQQGAAEYYWEILISPLQ